MSFYQDYDIFIGLENGLYYIVHETWEYIEEDDVTRYISGYRWNPRNDRIPVIQGLSKYPDYYEIRKEIEKMFGKK